MIHDSVLERHDQDQGSRNALHEMTLMHQQLHLVHDYATADIMMLMGQQLYPALYEQLNVQHEMLLVAIIVYPVQPDITCKYRWLLPEVVVPHVQLGIMVMMLQIFESLEPMLESIAKVQMLINDHLDSIQMHRH